MQGLRCRRSLNFNPRSPWGERRLFPLMFILTLLFQSTLPVGGATTRSSNRRTTSRISIHAPRGGSDNNQFEVRCQDYISIHAPRGGSDTVRSIWPQPRSISIHAPRGGSDFLFLHLLPIITNFNPRSPWGERHLHRPLRDYQQGFQSTLPVGGATLCSVPAVLDTLISIHAPRGGSDAGLASPTAATPYFNPRSPWGERQRKHDTGSAQVDFNPRSPWGERRGKMAVKAMFLLFQSTLPVGGATSRLTSVGNPWGISIHAPRGGSDAYPRETCGAVSDFNPRSPWGERLLHLLGGVQAKNFNPRSPWGERLYQP